MENYEILGKLGEGYPPPECCTSPPIHSTYGIVLKARFKETGEIVAIKKFKETELNEEVRKTALREVRILKQLRHVNIIRLIEHFRRKKKLYLVFEHVDHNLLEDIESSTNGMDPGVIKKLMFQLLSGTLYIHSRNVIHRDIKPENLLISPNGTLKICDFGFARTITGPDAKYTDYVSTRWYRSPELLVGDTSYGKPCDVWAIGCLFAEMSTGSPLFPGSSDIDQLHLIQNCIGQLTPHFQSVFEGNPNYCGVQIPEVTTGPSLSEKLTSLRKEALEFIEGCLSCNPQDRLSCKDLLHLSYFQDDLTLLNDVVQGFELDHQIYRVKNRIIHHSEGYEHEEKKSAPKVIQEDDESVKMDKSRHSKPEMKEDRRRYGIVPLESQLLAERKDFRDQRTEEKKEAPVSRVISRIVALPSLSIPESKDDKSPIQRTELPSRPGLPWMVSPEPAYSFSDSIFSKNTKSISSHGVHSIFNVASTRATGYGLSKPRGYPGGPIPVRYTPTPTMWWK